MASISRLSPALARTLRPGLSLVPLAERVMLTSARSSNAVAASSFHYIRKDREPKENELVSNIKNAQHRILATRSEWVEASIELAMWHRGHHHPGELPRTLAPRLLPRLQRLNARWASRCSRC